MLSALFFDCNVRQSETGSPARGGAAAADGEDPVSTSYQFNVVGADADEDDTSAEEEEDLIRAHSRIQRQ